jgi:hypothetical protein
MLFLLRSFNEDIYAPSRQGTKKGKFRVMSPLR